MSQGRRFALGVVTSKGIVVATEGLDLFGLAPFFDTLITLEDTAHHKPHPDPLLAACERLGIAPAGALYVGDAVFDIQAGKAAGTRTAGVAWGAGTVRDLSAAGPDYLLNSMEELLALAEGMAAA